MKKSCLDAQGFTIIETSLVIAIGGLILLMVFVALPALQRSQRDTSRRESISKLITNIKNYQINNRGALPSAPTAASGEEITVDDAQSVGTNDTTWKGLYKLYLSDFVDPDGEPYVLHVVKCNPNGRTTLNGANTGALDGSGRTSLGSSRVNADDESRASADETINDSRVIDTECRTTASGGVANVSEQDFPNDHKISVVLGATCSGTKAVETANPRNVAVLYKLEGAGEYCADTN